jgi:hypothetical protein
MSDEIVFNFNGIKIRSSARRVFRENFDFSYCLYYHKNPDSLLNSLCDKYGTDKGEVKTGDHPYPWASHTYADFVERHFDHCREYIKNVFECGLGSNNPNIQSSMGVNGKPGASLRVWREYFPNANIFGADIDAAILFKEERINTFFVDQTKPQSITQMFQQINVEDFDLMIDDGLHTCEAGICLLENSFHRLKSNGIYIIEDVSIASLMAFKSYFSGRHYKVDFVNLYREGHPIKDNSLIVIRK